MSPFATLRAWLWRRGFYQRVWFRRWHPDATRALQEQVDSAQGYVQIPGGTTRIAGTIRMKGSYLAGVSPEQSEVVRDETGTNEGGGA